MTLFAAPLTLFLLAAAPEASKFYTISVVDEQTGRGVPLVELRTVNEVRYYTDSNGVVAFHNPALMGQTVFFHVKSHGYEFDKDGYGFRGKTLEVKEGGSATLKIKRVNIAERLYRVTGEGIYTGSVLVGKHVPIKEPLLNAQVMGSDSVVNAIYKGKIHWFWGDTNRPGSPLGNFHVPGATSLLPADGGLDPDTGVDLTYYVDPMGFAKPTCEMPGPGPTWINGLVAFHDAEGRERMFAVYAKIRNMLEVYERGLVEWNDEAKQFEKVVTFSQEAPIYPEGHTFLLKEDGTTYVYFCNPYPLTRVVADPEALKDLSRYETFSCLRPQGRPRTWSIDRDNSGAVRYAWKKNTLVSGSAEQDKLLEQKQMRADEALLQLRDVATGVPVSAHGGSVYWNNYRRRWVMITVERLGTSMLGEVWFAEADTPLGPWVYARKIVTHENYSFYNPKQHPFFDKDGGRIIYFEGTYTAAFSGNSETTPRYDYNQVMYKLDLSGSRLDLPVAVYRFSMPNSPERYGTIRRQMPVNARRVPAFFAYEKPVAGTLPVYERTAVDGGPMLTTDQPPPDRSGRPNPPLFYALSASVGAVPATTMPLHEFSRADGRVRTYSTEPSLDGYQRSTNPVCLVWRSPSRVVLPIR